jgi:hypothetical protein
MVLQGARWDFYLDVSYARQVFEKNRRKLSDLSPKFWESLRRLGWSAVYDDLENLKVVFSEFHKQLGAPGDFGYGTPCGDALQTLYAAWNKLLKESPAAETKAAV